MKGLAIAVPTTVVMYALQTANDSAVLLRWWPVLAAVVSGLITIAVVRVSASIHGKYTDRSFADVNKRLDSLEQTITHALSTKLDTNVAEAELRAVNHRLDALERRA